MYEHADGRVHPFAEKYAGKQEQYDTDGNGMFCFIFLAVAARPSAWGKRRKSEFMSTTSEVSMATSVPPPMAIPIRQCQ